MKRFLSAVLFASVAVASCGDSSKTLFTEAQALEAARAFQAALAANDPVAVASRCRAPFTFQGRAWATADDVARNWAKEHVRVRHVIEGFDAFEARSRRDLEAGRFPRNETVDEEKRAGRVEQSGVEANGWLVRVYSGAKQGYLLALNVRDGGAGLSATAFDL